MLLNQDNGELFNHLHIRVAPLSNRFIPVHEGNKVFWKHVGSRGLVCIAERLVILPDVYEGLLGVCGIPLGLVLVVEIIVVFCLSYTLKV